VQGYSFLASRNFTNAYTFDAPSNRTASLAKAEVFKKQRATTVELAEVRSRQEYKVSVIRG
jgi:hypothetical protein